MCTLWHCVASTFLVLKLFAKFMEGADSMSLIGANSVDRCMKIRAPCPFSGVTSYGRVWRIGRVSENEAWCVSLYSTSFYFCPSSSFSSECLGVSLPLRQPSTTVLFVHPTCLLTHCVKPTTLMPSSCQVMLISPFPALRMLHDAIGRACPICFFCDVVWQPAWLPVFSACIPMRNRCLKPDVSGLLILALRPFLGENRTSSSNSPARKGLIVIIN